MKKVLTIAASPLIFSITALTKTKMNEHGCECGKIGKAIMPVEL